MACARLSDRRIISIAGPDRVAFLQGLVSNDVSTCDAHTSIWAALLTPKGRYRADFFLSAQDDRLLLDIDATRADATLTQLKRYSLRAKIEISLPEGQVYAGWDVPPPSGACADPRLPQAGWRKIILEGADMLQCDHDLADYAAHCLALGLPPSSIYQIDETLLLEANFDLLNGISWIKGCYVGQEVTARMHYRGGVKKRLVPVTTPQACLPDPGTILTLEDGQEAGEMRLAHVQTGVALLRKPFWRRSFRLNGIEIMPSPPAWFPNDDSDI
ncbi:folate-binding protein [Candidatus Kirkpatrickella diaphorinae]|uniref:Folate-binding protein n=1 Tax=Candidatus Kirkpatrickella diaphorinae TaxID=2984322 RepID=A0ABY6GL93_9PROT|nr:folate-binding protein [Candidatus Kirkpatrickella diaphorinae]UYH51578.1 folate-binding protein [Candidatus Kirkpatrickella diaphorinae]